MNFNKSMEIFRFICIWFRIDSKLKEIAHKLSIKTKEDSNPA